METLQLTTLLVNCGLTSNRNILCDIILKKKRGGGESIWNRVFILQVFIFLFSILFFLGNHLIYYLKGQRQAGTSLVCVL